MSIEWPLVLFTIFAGSGAGVLAFAGVGEFFGTSKKVRSFAAIAALVLLIVGGLFSLLHLGNPGNFMAAATNVFSFSPISLELIFLGLGVIIALIYLVVINREGMASKILGICGIIIGVLFAYFSGHIYEIVAIRPAWAVPTLSFTYMLSALTIGGFLLLTFQILLKDEKDSVKKIALVVLIVAVLTVIMYIIYGVIAPIGDNAALFWIVAVAIGGLVAVIAGLLVYMKNMNAMVYVGILTAIAGGVAFRAVMWLSGSAFVPNLFDIAQNARNLFPF